MASMLCGNCNRQVREGAPPFRSWAAHRVGRLKDHTLAELVDLRRFGHEGGDVCHNELDVEVLEGVWDAPGLVREPPRTIARTRPSALATPTIRLGIVSASHALRFRLDQLLGWRTCPECTFAWLSVAGARMSWKPLTSS